MLNLITVSSKVLTDRMICLRYHDGAPLQFVTQIYRIDTGRYVNGHDFYSFGDALKDFINRAAFYKCDLADAIPDCNYFDLPDTVCK